MKDDKKKSVSLIMGKLMDKKPEVEEAPTEDGIEQDDSIAVDTAAEELISAIESKSPKAVVSAIKSLMDLCQSEPEPEQE
ncbi:MAG: hypothetical protein ACAH17_00110 [Candidatus Paceibacterota bacterium]